MKAAPSNRIQPKGQFPAALLPALSLRQVQYFVMLAHTRSFTESAAQLCITQPALSAAILQMETQFGATLFDRSGHPVALTEFGSAILPLAEHLLNTACRSFADMAISLTTRAHTVKIGLIPSVATRLLSELAEIQKNIGAIHIELVDLPNVDLLEAIERGEVDFGVGATPLGTTRLELHRLWEDEMMLLLPAGDSLCRHARVPWALLEGRDIAVFRRGETHDMVIQMIAEHRLPVKLAYFAGYVEPLNGLVRAGMALAVLPRLYVENLHDPALATRPLQEPSLKRWIVLVRTHHPSRNPTVTQCFDALKKALTRNPCSSPKKARGRG